MSIRTPAYVRLCASGLIVFLFFVRAPVAVAHRLELSGRYNNPFGDFGPHGYNLAAAWSLAHRVSLGQELGLLGESNRTTLLSGRG